MGTVVRHLIINPKPDKDCNRHSHRQPGNVYETVSFVFSKISKGDFKIVLDHSKANK